MRTHPSINEWSSLVVQHGQEDFLAQMDFVRLKFNSFTKQHSMSAIFHPHPREWIIFSTPIFLLCIRIFMVIQ